MMPKKQFLNEVVNGWMRNDLVRMRDVIRPDNSEIGNINFPLALCTLSYMEYLGGYLIGRDQKFFKNVQVYIKTCFDHPEDYPAEILRDLVRNGLSHDYFPRGAISRNGKRPPIYKGKSYDFVIDAETLTNDFINSLEKFTVSLNDATYKSRMDEALEKIAEYKTKHFEYINKLVMQPEDDQATPSSGPSGYPDSLNTTTLDPSHSNN